MLRHNNVVPSHNIVADEPVTVGVGDGALELEPPEEGATIENPPNGGHRAWFIVLSSALINALLGIMEMLKIISIFNDKMSSDTGIDTHTQAEILLQFMALVNLYAPLGAIVMIHFGYRATVCIGAGIVMVTVIILSHLKDDTEDAVKFFLYGPGAIGMSFIKVGALIPVLEYFSTKRMTALFLSRLGTYAGQIIFSLIHILSSSDINWRAYLRGCTGLCIGIGLLGLTLQELKLNMKDGTGTFVARTLGVGSKQIFKSTLFWSTCAIYFFYQWGIETPLGQLSSMSDHLGIEKKVGQNLVYVLSPAFGKLFGMFLAWIFKKVYYEEKSRLHMGTLEKDRMIVVFRILFVAAFSMAIGCFIAPKAVNFWYFFPFSILFAALFAFCEGLRDDAVPEEFGKENVRIVEGLILMFAGLGGVITNEIGADIEDDDDDNWKKLFYYGGGMLLLSTSVTMTVLVLIQSSSIPSKFKSNAVLPLNQINEGFTGKKSKKTTVVNTTLQQQPGASTNSNGGFQNKDTRSETVDNQIVLPLNQINEGSTSKKSRKTTVVNTTLQQQPGASTNSNGGFQNKDTRSETVDNQVGGNGFQEPNTIIQNQAGSFQYPQQQQQAAMPILYLHSSIQPAPEQAVFIGNPHMNAQPYLEASVFLPNQNGSFIPYLIQARPQQTVQNDVPQNQPQCVVTTQDLQ
ncbi:uncharacterized protein LOC132721055 [Ruditapes philippinarum]|uniref:uncharacterized protein LOC132721055 n=1 Tax=Ruditapes philippinarum TaxID=129788 RepID=UPI00295A7016|nr:uncharacterized protein LOC132721055 [Ruditapes philippinarum]